MTQTSTLTPDGNVVSGWTATDATEFYWDVFDAAPLAIRRALQDSVIEFNAETVMAYFKSLVDAGSHSLLAAFACIDAIAWNEDQELTQFSRLHGEIYGHPTPHCSAGVSIQRYGRRK